MCDPLYAASVWSSCRFTSSILFLKGSMCTRWYQILRKYFFQMTNQHVLTAQTTGMRHHKAWCFAWVFHNNIATAEHIPNTSSLILNIIEKVDSTLAGGIAFTKNLKTVAFGRNCNSTHFSYQLYTHDDGIELKLKLSYQICRPSDDREPVPRVRDFRRGEICNAFPKYWSFPLTSLFPFSATSASQPSTNL
jgi:hypothetical protein